MDKECFATNINYLGYYVKICYILIAWCIYSKRVYLKKKKEVKETERNEGHRIS